MLQLCSVSNSLSHAHIENKLRGIFFKKKLPSSLFIASKCIQRVLCVCIVNHNHGYTTVAPDMVLSMGQIELNFVFMLN